MIDKETVITHLMIIHTWAEFAREHDLQFFTAKHLESIAQWSDDALILLKEQEPKVGRWISIPHKKARICNICYADEPYKFADDDADVYDFCPHCGAKMEGQ